MGMACILSDGGDQVRADQVRATDRQPKPATQIGRRFVFLEDHRVAEHIRHQRTPKGRPRTGTCHNRIPVRMHSDRMHSEHRPGPLIWRHTVARNVIQRQSDGTH